MTPEDKLRLLAKDYASAAEHSDYRADEAAPALLAAALAFARPIVAEECARIVLAEVAERKVRYHAQRAKPDPLVEDLDIMRDAAFAYDAAAAIREYGKGGA